MGSSLFSEKSIDNCDIPMAMSLKKLKKGTASFGIAEFAESLFINAKFRESQEFFR
jgi:hypothetical protein